eukprot:1935951-Amphidinium_carterae.1
MASHRQRTIQERTDDALCELSLGDTWHDNQDEEGPPPGSRAGGGADTENRKRTRSSVPLGPRVGAHAP